MPPSTKCAAVTLLCQKTGMDKEAMSSFCPVTNLYVFLIIDREGQNVIYNLMIHKIDNNLHIQKTTQQKLALI